MLSTRIIVSDKQLPINSKKFRIKQLDEIKAALSKSKSQLDTEYKQANFEKYWREFDPFKNERTLVAELGNTCNVSNAWLKCYEILNYFKLLPDQLHHADYVHFDNAAFPGSFILSTHHSIKTQKPWHEAYQWYGSSLLSANEQSSAPLEDKYHLYKNYPENWLMTETNNGDVLVRGNQIDFCKRLGSKVDLYTSDLGFDVSADYNNQEALQAPANIGQILTGLLTLRKGGSFITKQYMMFEPITLSVMYLAASFFEEFYICKPATSREANSETYLVGKGFLGGVYLQHPYIRAAFDRLDEYHVDKSKSLVSIFDAKSYPKQYVVQVVQTCKDIFNRQIDKIDKDILRTHAAIKQKNKALDNNVIDEFLKTSETDIRLWYDKNSILPLVDDKKLSIHDMHDTNDVYNLW
jgi:23S rRNA U2552 (ribose-2'-O)-methylase RlmE/FtsJ